MGERFSGRWCAVRWRVWSTAALIPVSMLDGDQRRRHAVYPPARASLTPGPRAERHVVFFMT
jgi:hypothetical protein